MVASLQLPYHHYWSVRLPSRLSCHCPTVACGGRPQARPAAPTAPTSTGKKSNDLATFVEARLGKPSHLLEGDKLRQFIANSGKVLRFW